MPARPSYVGEPNDVHALREFIIKHFDEESLKSFCVDLYVDYESLPALGKNGKARELVSLMKRGERLEELARALGWKPQLIVVQDLDTDVLAQGKDVEVYGTMTGQIRNAGQVRNYGTITNDVFCIEFENHGRMLGTVHEI